MPPQATKTQICLGLALGSYLGLMLCISLWTLWLRPPDVDNPSVIWAVQIVPLLLPILGLIRCIPRSYAWLCFIVLFYFSAAVVGLYQNPQDLYPWIKTLLSLMLFISAILYCRWRTRELATPEKSSP